ncbi:hypothetical protein WH47_04514 [Habropoda laboriosa]|uniref:Uncharacterized protein n=1 Tax=Habropoda laboriosa TaxID=597456 RepID=A0A0L7R225_9HYME|nr:hypothetical protein WH47_04514 [Habropoda laboriosa]
MFQSNLLEQYLVYYRKKTLRASDKNDSKITVTYLMYRNKTLGAPGYPGCPASV